MNKLALSAYFKGLFVALCGALLARYLNLPIPWLLGSLLLTALFNLNGVRVAAPAWGRKFGLTIIGISLGLFVTPQMLGLIVQHAWLLAASSLFAIALGVMGTFWVYRFGGVDFTTAWFASAVGGASEMANIAQQHCADVGKVVSAHSLRVLMVVSIVPFFYQFVGWHGADDTQIIRAEAFHWDGLIVLLALAYATARFFEWRKWSNPWTFGPLLSASVLTALGIHLSVLPDFASPLGQLMIGWALGNKFAPGFFRTAPRFLSVVALSVLMSLFLAALVTILLTRYSEIAVATLGLGLAPGGVAEMTITAKVLQLGVPLVTAFHIVRMVSVVGSATLLHDWIKKKMA